MKKNYILLSMFLFSCVGLMAQTFTRNVSINKAELKPEYKETFETKKGSNTNNKAPGDTLYYEDFGSGSQGVMPLGWSNNNNAGNTDNWIWSTSAPGGQYTAGGLNPIPALASSTASNGFMSLQSDLYNTPAPGGVFRPMDVSLESPAITIPAKAAVLVQWQQSVRFCCNANTVEYVLEVSTDGINWSSPYNVLGSLAVNTASANPSTVTINVSADLANQTTVYLRFRQGLSSHYYWMIDDVTILEGNANNMQLVDFEVDFSNGADFNPIATQIPQKIMPPLAFDAATFNAGGNPQTNAYLDIRVIQDSTLTGPGLGLAYQDSIRLTPLGVPVQSVDRDTVTVAPYINTSPGVFRSVFEVKSDSINQDPPSARADFSFKVSDSILARDLGNFAGSTGPGQYVGGGNDQDAMGILITVGDTATLTSIDVYVGNYAGNDGVQIKPGVWRFNDTATTFQNRFGPDLAGVFIPTLIDATMFDTWINLDFTLGNGPIGLDSGQYVIGWIQETGAASSLDFRAGRATDMEPLAPAATNFIRTSGWGTVTAVPGIRGRFGGLTVGAGEIVNSSKMGFEVAPNPNNGQFNVVINNDVETDYTLNVRNMLGQSVFTDLLSVNKQRTMQLDLTDYEKGVYFVSLENDDERLVKKVVVK